MAVLLSPVGGAAVQFFDNSGIPLAGGNLYSYVAGTTTPQVTYTSSAGTISHPNPIVLDASGRIPSGEIWLTDGAQYKFILNNANNVLIGTYDNITGINDTSGVNSFISNLANSSDVVKGDALVGFRQSNAIGNLAGSVGRTVHLKLQELVSVKDFGAVGDGITNDTSAIVAALLSNNTIFFPAGEYLVSGNINIQNKTLIGNSWRDTIIRLSGSNTNTPMFINSANSGSSWGSGGGFSFNNLNLRGNWDGTTPNPVSISNFDNLGSIVRWHAGAYVNVSNCKIQDSFAHALAFARLGYSYFQFNEITTIKYDGIHLSGPSGSESITSTWVSNNSIHSCRGVACIYLKNGLTMQATQNVLEDASIGFYVDGNDNRGVSFCFNDIEQMSNSGVYLEGNGSSFSVSNNFLGVTTPITIGSSGPEFKSGVFTNNAFGNLDYVTFMPTIGSGTTFDTPLNFFGRAQNGSGVGKIGWKSNNNFNVAPEVEMIGVHYGTVNQRGGSLLIRTADPSTGVLDDRFIIDYAGNTYPGSDNAQTLGSASNRWSVVYAGTGTINTSDESTKQDVRSLLNVEKNAAIEIKSLFKAYRFKDAVALKGDTARIHFGAMAQDVATVFAKHGLDVNQYGLFCSDTWYVDADGRVYPAQVDTEDNPLDNLTPVTQLGLRYNELFAFIIAAI